MPMKMESGAQMVPTSFMDSSDLSASCVPDFDLILRDSEVPSPSNLYSHSFFDSPDYLLLSSLEESCLLLSDGPSEKPARAATESPILRETLAKPSAPLRDQEHRLLAPQSSLPSDESVAMLESLASAVSQVLVKQEPFEVSTSSVSCHGLTCSSSGAAAATTTTIKPAGTAQVKQELSLMEDYCDQMMDLDSLEEVQSLVMKQLANDIGVACNHLNISADPMNWSCDDVRTWLLWTLRQYNLPMIRLEYFQMDGAALCYLSEYNFRQRSAQCGEVLFAQLELWKAACHRIPERAPLPVPTSAPQSQTKPAAPAVFKAEDSLLDMSAFFQWPIANSPMATPPREGSISPDSATAAVVPDSSSTGHSSDYSSDGGLQSDDETSEDGLETEKPARHSSSHSHIHLWQFLKELLLHPQLYSSCIRWLDRTKGVFKIEDSVRVARLWGKRKNRPAMNYDKLSRSIRQYYKKGIMKKTERSQRLVYQFCHPYCL